VENSTISAQQVCWIISIILIRKSAEYSPARLNKSDLPVSIPIPRNEHIPQ
jgi:hypothetical protein